jgi:hypothetical protein
VENTLGTPVSQRGNLKVAKPQTQDPVFRQAGEFGAMWRDFFQKLEVGIKAPDLTAEMEEEFLKLKTRIAMRKQILLRLLPDDFSMADDIMKVLIESPSLDALRSESPIKINAIKGQWHEVFIALNKMMGQIKDRKAEEAKKGFFAKLLSR